MQSCMQRNGIFPFSIFSSAHVGPKKSDRKVESLHFIIPMSRFFIHPLNYCVHKKCTFILQFKYALVVIVLVFLVFYFKFYFIAGCALRIFDFDTFYCTAYSIASFRQPSVCWKRSKNICQRLRHSKIKCQRSSTRMDIMHEMSNKT